jgi:hypothetical protein
VGYLEVTGGHPRPKGEEGLGHPATDSLCGAGHQRDAPLEPLKRQARRVVIRARDHG